MKKITILAFIIASNLGVANAQNFQFHTGVTFPLGDFAKNNIMDEKAGNAVSGFNIGVKSYIPLFNPNLSLAFCFDFFYNALTSKYEDYLESTVTSVNIDDITDHSYPKYLNMPLTLGLNYTQPLYKKFKVYGEAGVGINYSRMTSDVAEFKGGAYNIYNYNDRVDYDTSWGFCYNLEGGFLIDWFKLGLRYNSLGNHSYKTKWLLTKDGEEVESKKMTDTKRMISNLHVVIGFFFGIAN